MLLRQWCQYDMYYATRTPEGLWEDACEHCKMHKACECNLHCGHEVFDKLINLPSEEAVDQEMSRMKGYHNSPSRSSRTPSKRGQYFWTMSCSGQGPQRGYNLSGYEYPLYTIEEELPQGEEDDYIS